MPPEAPLATHLFRLHADFLSEPHPGGGFCSSPSTGSLLCVRRGIPPRIGANWLSPEAASSISTKPGSRARPRTVGGEPMRVSNSTDHGLRYSLPATPPSEGLVLLFGLARPRSGAELADFTPNEEVRGNSRSSTGRRSWPFHYTRRQSVNTLRAAGHRGSGVDSFIYSATWTIESGNTRLRRGKPRGR